MITEALGFLPDVFWFDMSKFQKSFQFDDAMEKC